MNSGRTVFAQLIEHLPHKQMDKATPQDQGFLRRQRERGENPDLDRVSVYVLVAIVRKRFGLESSLYQILQILSLTLFEKTPISYALQTIDPDANFATNVNQLILFEF